MEFTDEAIERAILYANAKSVEDCLPYLIPNEQNNMEHKFVS